MAENPDADLEEQDATDVEQRAAEKPDAEQEATAAEQRAAENPHAYAAENHDGAVVASTQELASPEALLSTSAGLAATL